MRSVPNPQIKNSQNRLEIGKRVGGHCMTFCMTLYNSQIGGALLTLL